jgi:hypothetical protein
MKTADLAGRVVMADVVIVGLGHRDMHEAENQNSDSQVGPASPGCTPIRRHDLSPVQFGLDRLTACVIEWSRIPPTFYPHLGIMNQQLAPVKLRRLVVHAMAALTFLVR